MMERFNQRLENLPMAIWQKIARIDELKGQWSAGARLSPQVLGRLKKSVLITSSGASTRIEGARLNDDDVEKLIQGINIQKFKERDKGEVRGYYELLQNVFSLGKQIAFSENTIKHFHQEILKYVDKDQRHRGAYKFTENKVEMISETSRTTIFETTPPYLTAKEMSELIIWTQEALKEKKIHALLVIANFCVEFLAIHPFSDGNGRLSRVLTNFLLLQNDYGYVPYVSHEKLIEQNKVAYYLALRQSQKTFKKKKENIVPWLEFFLDILLQQTQMAVDLLSAENIEKLLSPKQLKVWQYLQTVKEATPQELTLNLKIARPTINQILNKLLQFKKITRIGLGRSTRYKTI